MRVSLHFAKVPVAGGRSCLSRAEPPFTFFGTSHTHLCRIMIETLSLADLGGFRRICSRSRQTVTASYYSNRHGLIQLRG
jgi:hypothetical protein